MISKHTLLSNDLFGDLNPKDWPISIADLPKGSALVGGSVRDGLLNKLSQKPDLDFVIPINAIKFSEKLSKKINATFIKLDEKRDIARLVINGWTLDFARQVGENLDKFFVLILIFQPYNIFKHLFIIHTSSYLFLFL